MRLLLALLLAVGAPVAPGTSKVQQGRGGGPYGEWLVVVDGGISIAGPVSVNVLDAGPPLNVNPHAVLMPDGGSPASEGTLALLALEMVNGTAQLRVINLPPPPKRNALTGAAVVDGSGVVQPVSGTFFQTTQPVAGVDGGALATDALAALIAAELVNGTAAVRVLNMPPAPARNPVTGAAKVDGSGAVQPVSATALPLPAGAAQETGGNLAAILAALSSPPLAAAVTVVQQPINPFLPRCNAVRRSSCQP